MDRSILFSATRFSDVQVKRGEGHAKNVVLGLFGEHSTSTFNGRIEPQGLRGYYEGGGAIRRLSLMCRFFKIQLLVVRNNLALSAKFPQSSFNNRRPASSYSP
jgi:hypothetical protein